MEELRQDPRNLTRDRTELPFRYELPDEPNPEDLPLQNMPRGQPLDLPYTGTDARTASVAFDYTHRFDNAKEDPHETILASETALRALHPIRIRSGYAKDIFGGVMGYQIRLQGPESQVKSAAADAVTIFGLPDFVRGDSRILEEMLAERGKVLVRKLEGCLLGKHVVDRPTEWGVRPY